LVFQAKFYVKWQNVVTREFSVSNGTKQDSILSLFSGYILELLVAIDSMLTAVGCFIGNHCFDILVYADDIVLRAPS